jgi:crossover junction endodeoxyribonuclease RusA
VSRTVRTWRLSFPNGEAPVSSNRRGHWSVRASEQKWWKDATVLLIREKRIPAVGRLDLLLEVTPPDRRRRDSDNLVALLLKPIKDGFVTAGVVPDDTDEYVSWRVVLHQHDGPPDPLKRWKYELTVREVL